MAKTSTDQISSLQETLRVSEQLCLSSMDASLSGQFDTAAKLLDEGMARFTEAHRIHAEMLTKPDQKVDLYTVHMEDLLMSVELYTVMAGRLLKAARKVKASV